MSNGPAPLQLLLLIRRLRAQPNGAVADDVLGECERAALAAAMTLKDELHAHVTVVAVGPARREDRVLAMALRAGCDRAMRIHDNMLAGLDFLGIARILAATANHAGYDLILCGARSQDEVQGAVGPAVAELLEVPHITGALDVRIEGESAVVVRRGDGLVQTCQVELPALVTISRFSRRADAVMLETEEEAALDDDDAPRTPPATIEEVNLAEIGLDPRELTHRAELLGQPRQLRHPRQVTLLATGELLAARLRSDHVLE